MFLKDPFAIGPAQPLTLQQIAAKKLDEEWEAAGKPSLDDQVAERNRYITGSLKRAFEGK